MPEPVGAFTADGASRDPKPPADPNERQSGIAAREMGKLPQLLSGGTHASPVRAGYREAVPSTEFRDPEEAARAVVTCARPALKTCISSGWASKLLFLRS